MAAAALTARLLPSLAARRSERAPALGLDFDRPGGPIVAVCALSGGAGATTVAYMLAAAAARESKSAILVCDAGGPAAGLALYAGCKSRRSLAELAEQVADGEEPGERVYELGDNGLRVIAAGPRFRVGGSSEAVARVLDRAREVHGLTAIDCGTLQRPAEQAALVCATHALWVVEAAGGGVMRAQRTLELVAPGEGREIVVARRSRRGLRAPHKSVRALARRRGAPVVLFPEVGDLTEVPLGKAIEAAQTALTALGARLRR